MDLQRKTYDGITTFIFTGQLNAITATLAGTFDTGALHLVLNLAGLDFISSAGLRVLLATSKKLSRQNGKLVLCELQPAVRKVLEISGLLTVFVVAATEEEAQSLATH
jgi:stage II sporulation protein AA (anti-sigma F factor antagonist)